VPQHAGFQIYGSHVTVGVRRARGSEDLRPHCALGHGTPRRGHAGTGFFRVVDPVTDQGQPEGEGAESPAMGVGEHGGIVDWLKRATLWLEEARRAARRKSERLAKATA